MCVWIMIKEKQTNNRQSMFDWMLLRELIFPKLTQLFSSSLEKVNPSGQTSNPVAPYELWKSLDSYFLPAMPICAEQKIKNKIEQWHSITSNNWVMIMQSMASIIKWPTLLLINFICLEVLEEILKAFCTHIFKCVYLHSLLTYYNTLG